MSQIVNRLTYHNFIVIKKS